MTGHINDRKVLLAKIVATKGLKGELKLKSFTSDPLSVIDYDIFDENDRIYVITSAYINKGTVIVKLEGIDNIDQAQGFIGTDLYTFRGQMPELDEEDFYHVDLLGLRVLDTNEVEIGNIIAIHNYKAGDIIEIKKLDDSVILIPFRKECVPVINIKDNYVIVKNDHIE